MIFKQKFVQLLAALLVHLTVSLRPQRTYTYFLRGLVPSIQATPGRSYCCAALDVLASIIQAQREINDTYRKKHRTLCKFSAGRVSRRTSKWFQRDAVKAS